MAKCEDWEVRVEIEGMKSGGADQIMNLLLPYITK